MGTFETEVVQDPEFTCLDIHGHSMKVCYRPSSALEKDDSIVRTPCCFTLTLSNSLIAVGSPAGPVRCLLPDSRGLFEQHSRWLIYLCDAVGTPRVCRETQLPLHRENWIDEHESHLRLPLSGGIGIKAL